MSTLHLFSTQENHYFLQNKICICTNKQRPSLKKKGYTFTEDSFQSSEAILKLTGSFPDNSRETCSSWSWKWLFLHGHLELFSLSVSLSAETKTLPEWKLWRKKIQHGLFYTWLSLEITHYLTLPAACYSGEGKVMRIPLKRKRNSAPKTQHHPLISWTKVLQYFFFLRFLWYYNRNDEGFVHISQRQIKCYHPTWL